MVIANNKWMKGVIMGRTGELLYYMRIQDGNSEETCGQ